MANGLLSRARGVAPGDDQAQPQGQAMPGADDQGAGDETDAPAGEAAAPEEQAQYDLLVGQCLRAVYQGGQVSPAVLDRLKAGKPVDALAGAAVNVVSMVVKSGQQNGHEFTADVIMHGGKEVLQDLAALAGTAKIHDYTQDEIDGAWYVAVDLYRSQHPGEINQDQAKQDLQGLQQAEKSGQLAQVLPGIDKFKVKAATDGEQAGGEQAA